MEAPGVAGIQDQADIGQRFVGQLFLLLATYLKVKQSNLLVCNYDLCWWEPLLFKVHVIAFLDPDMAGQLKNLFQKTRPIAVSAPSNLRQMDQHTDKLMDGPTKRLIESRARD